MMTRKMMQKAASYIRKHSQADDWSFNINSTNAARTRFAQNGITQHISGDNNGISLTVAFDAKTGSAFINNTSEEGLDFLIKTAETIARRNQPDPEYVATEAAVELTPTMNFSSDTDKLKPVNLVNIVKQCVANAKAKEAVVSGMTEKDTEHSAMFTRNGFEGFYDYTSFSHSMTMKKNGVETKINRSMMDYKDFNIEEIIGALNTQFDSLSNPEPIEAAPMPVILRPAAVADWFVYLFWMLDRRNADEGISPFTDQLGKRFFGVNFTLRSVMNMPGLMSPPYSGEGVASRNIEWIKNGVIENMFISRYYARKLGVQPTHPYNVLIEGGNATEDEMMKMVPRGVILNKLWYIRDIDRKAGTQTGLTRDGVLYFEDGKIVKAVNNFRWNEILHDVTRRIIAKGPEILMDTWCKVPTLLIDGFNFVDTTTF
ncbi:MAG: TldD/PmbA family protein [Candidatus Cloacimonetes bacterium]|nr:TldD/PmbA family protein [Candidatus Cloacimonadota bacterium]